MYKVIKIGWVVIAMAFLGNIFFNENSDQEADIRSMIKNGALIIDTRSSDEFSGGHVEDAVNIPYDLIPAAIEQHTTDKSEPIIVYCHAGVRSGIAKQSLEQLGFTHVINGGSYQRMQDLLAQ